MSSEKKKMRKNIRHVQYSLANKQEDRRASGNDFPKYRQISSSKNTSPPRLTKAPIFLKDNQSEQHFSIEEQNKRRELEQKEREILELERREQERLE